MKPFSVAILIPSDYWKSNSTFEVAGNHLSHRSVPHLFRALRKAGAQPTCVSEDSPQRPGQFDALLLPGGADIDPRFYGKSLGKGMRQADLRPEWDAFQLGWARHFLNSGQPVLGICRGMQLLNVAKGGSLIQDLSEWGSPLDHLPAAVLTSPDLRKDSVHGLRVESGSRLALSLSDEVRVNSIHHQAVDQLGDGWRAVAWAEDGIIEAFENPQRPTQRAVQFHPEDMLRRRRRPDGSSEIGMQSLFDQWVLDGQAQAS